MSAKPRVTTDWVPPSIEEIVSAPEYQRWVTSLSRPLATSLVREAVERVRKDPGSDPARLDFEVRHALERWRGQAVAPVINATGVLIHTNLGRAPLDSTLWNEVAGKITGYTSLEHDLETGERGSRAPLVNRLVAQLAGAQAGLVVNNCAAAVLLMLCLARGKRVLVSRGELVQIGGGFKVPEIMAMSGCQLVEVGTTNRTVAADYEAAMDSDTAAILKVHRSNFSMSGFVEDADTKRLAALCRKRGILLLEDLGSGAVTDLSKYGLPRERLFSDAIRDGANVVCVSGDKLLGGPQAGLLAGGAEPISALAKHPLYRALRPGKISLAALEVTSLAHLSGRAEKALPLYGLLAATRPKLEERAKQVVKEAGVRGLEVTASEAVTGGGTLPGATLESVALAASPANVPACMTKLRKCDPPVIARVQEDRVYFDLRTVFPAQDKALARAIAQVAG